MGYEIGPASPDRPPTSSGLIAVFVLSHSLWLYIAEVRRYFGPASGRSDDLT